MSKIEEQLEAQKNKQMKLKPRDEDIKKSEFWHGDHKHLINDNLDEFDTKKLLD